MALTPLAIGTIVYSCLLVVAVIVVTSVVTARSTTQREKSENRSTAFIVTVICVVCLYLTWVSAYMHQLYPLIDPMPEAAAH
mmetsp:Transcript_8434/g.9533  ORF Transcript_8434/g.9533 Transcript_8434/m.9533 type:complete len:82 (-) Transcript_8434:179-424(-)